MRSDIDAACTDGRLTCSARPISSLPTMSLADIGMMPGYALQIVRSFLFVDRAVPVLNPSAGDEPGVMAIDQTLNHPPAFAAATWAGAGSQTVAAYAASLPAKVMQGALDAYRFAFLALVASAVILIGRRIVSPRMPRFDGVHRLLLIVAVLVASRVALLSLVGVTSFKTNNAIYIGPVYHLVALMLVLAIYASTRPGVHAGSRISA